MQTKKKTEKQKVKVVTEYVEVERKQDGVEEFLQMTGFLSLIVVACFVIYTIGSFFYDTYQTNAAFKEHLRDPQTHAVSYVPSYDIPNTDDSWPRYSVHGNSMWEGVAKPQVCTNANYGNIKVVCRPVK